VTNRNFEKKFLLIFEPTCNWSYFMLRIEKFWRIRKL